MERRGQVIELFNLSIKVSVEYPLALPGDAQYISWIWFSQKKVVFYVFEGADSVKVEIKWGWGRGWGRIIWGFEIKKQLLVNNVVYE